MVYEQSRDPHVHAAEVAPGHYSSRYAAVGGLETDLNEVADRAYAAGDDATRLNADFILQALNDRRPGATADARALLSAAPKPTQTPRAPEPSPDTTQFVDMQPRTTVMPLQPFGVHRQTSATPARDRFATKNPATRMPGSYQR